MDQLPKAEARTLYNLGILGYQATMGLSIASYLTAPLRAC